MAFPGGDRSIVWLWLGLSVLFDLHVASGYVSSSATVNRAGSLGWGAVEVSPKAFMSLEYQNFQVSIYKGEVSSASSVDNNVSQPFYCSPALTLEPTRTRTRFINSLQMFETAFTVRMWSSEYRKAIQQALSTQLHRNVSQYDVRILPIEDIRIDSHQQSDDYEIVNGWKSYANKQDTFTFRMRCLTNETCTNVADTIRNHPDDFTSGLDVYYSLQTQHTSKRSIMIRAVHVQDSELLRKVLREFPDMDSVYLIENDLKRIQSQVSTSVVATELTDEDYFVSSDEVMSVSRTLGTVMQAQNIDTDTFGQEMWNSVFWNAESARPDVTTKVLNEIYVRNARIVQEALKRSVSTSSTADSETSGSTGRSSAEDLVVIWAGLSVSGSWELVCRAGKSLGTTRPHKLDNLVLQSSEIVSAANHTESACGPAPLSVTEERARLKTILQDGRQFSKWNGQKFVINPIQLVRVNLAPFRGSAGTTIATLKMSVARRTSELRTRINVLEQEPADGESLPSKDGPRLDRLENTIAALSETVHKLAENISRPDIDESEKSFSTSAVLMEIRDLKSSTQQELVQAATRLRGEVFKNLSRTESFMQQAVGNISISLNRFTGNFTRAQLLGEDTVANTSLLGDDVTRNLSQTETQSQQNFSDLSARLLGMEGDIARQAMASQQSSARFAVHQALHQTDMLRLATRVDQVQSSISALDSRMASRIAVVERKTSLCRETTTLRATGCSNMTTMLASAPNGIVCIGNLHSPSPGGNFLVFDKVSSTLRFRGTESVNRGFTDFRPYVTWATSDLSGSNYVNDCSKLPSSLRSAYTGPAGTVYWCHKGASSGSVPINGIYITYCQSAKANSNPHMVVDDDGAISILAPVTGTLWY
ncbi:hypothetical protein BV898_08527 [Hypsibius exemplaris]|uniref:Uncharacterized protein n=1 Tax=Hypsibius exemplaris TaxID=2072580 RepID=A0A1W0WQF0_HYPEX|nr:hypothetical protein BV898_08527 [Hypsibius exemplaris]